MSRAAEPESARLDADLLVSHVTGLSRSNLFAYPDTVLDEHQRQALDALLIRRCAGEPLAYLTGCKEFWSLSLALGPGVLVPRPDTELLVETAIAFEPSVPAGLIVELGTGSGAIAIALAHELQTRRIVAVERYAQALTMAAHNIRTHAQGRVHAVQANWLHCLADNSAAMIIANPPYLASDDPHLPTLTHEPLTALVSGETGLEDIEHIIQDAQRVGKPGSLLLLEHGFSQGEAVRSLLQHYTYQSIDTAHDLAGHERISYGFVVGSGL